MRSKSRSRSAVGAMGSATVVAVLLAMAVGASAASATVYQWGIAGIGPLKEAKPAHTTFKLELTDLKGGPFGETVTVRCEGRGESLLSNEAGGAKTTVNSMKSLTGKEWIPCTRLAGECESPEAKAVNLPWHTEVLEHNGAPRDYNTSSSAGWTIKCTVFGITEEDKCTGTTNAAVVNTTPGPELVWDKVSEEKKTTCTHGGVGAGVIKGKELFELSGYQIEP